MQYVKANRNLLTSRLLERLSELSTAPVKPNSYPPFEEYVGLPSLQTSAPSPSALHRISSTRAWSTSRAIE